jgi:uncharacterized protein YbjT (DUF2867 family)
MKLCVFGATGRTGRQLVRKGLAAGHVVVAPVRTPDRLEVDSDRLEVIRADVLDPGSLSRLREHRDIDHVVIALGSKKLWGDRVRSEGTRNILASLGELDLRPRIWVISAVGVGESWKQLSLVNKLFARILLPAVMNEHDKQEQVVRASGFPYTLLRPCGLISTSDEGRYRIQDSGVLERSTIERSAVAACLLDNLGNQQWVDRAVTAIAG